MKWKPSAFCEDTVKLTFKDILSLLLGKQVKDGPCVISLYKMPLNYAEKQRIAHD